MATVLSSIDQDRESVERVLGEITRPEKVKTAKIEFREDHTGDEAVYITFPVSTQIALTPKRSKTLFDFVQRVEEKVYDLHLRRIPYVRLSETK